MKLTPFERRSFSSSGRIPATQEGARSSSSSVYIHCFSVSARTVSGSLDACGARVWAGMVLSALFCARCVKKGFYPVKMRRVIRALCEESVNNKMEPSVSRRLMARKVKVGMQNSNIQESRHGTMSRDGHLRPSWVVQAGVTKCDPCSAVCLLLLTRT
jgi:hypothetical protein